MFRRTILILALALTGLAPWTVKAQDMDRVAAVINDEPISLLDVIERVRLAMISSRIPDSIENRRKVLPQVMRKMIDEKLQLQEAARLKLSISSQDIENGIAMVEQQNRLPKGALIPGLKQQGVDPSTIREQIRADMTWVRLISRVIRPQVRIGTEEINDRLQMIQARQGQTEYLLAEIFLPVDDAKSEDESRALGEDLVAQLRAGTPFATLARQFSRSPSAASGGSLGWVAQETLDDDLRGIVSSLSNGEVSKLNRVGSGYMIIALINRRVAGQVLDLDASEITYARMILPVPTGPNAPSKQQLQVKAVNLLAQTRDCAGLEANAKQFGAVSFSRKGPVKASALPKNLHDALANAPVGQAAPPAFVPEGLQVAMLCSRNEVMKVEETNRDQVRQAIENERVDMLARRYLRDLRRHAFIDIRL
jgi:peptidyl-prolyl cis-trans isomerase SurA